MRTNHQQEFAKDAQRLPVTSTSGQLSPGVVLFMLRWSSLHLRLRKLVNAAPGTQGWRQSMAAGRRGRVLNFAAPGASNESLELVMERPR